MKTWQPILETLLVDGVKLPARVPLLDSHSRISLASQIGSTTDLRVEGSSIIGKNIFATTPEAERAWTLTKEGHLNTNSIGYRVDKFTDIPAGDTVKVKGREFTAPKDGPLRVSYKWQLMENSAVIIPADKKAKNRNNAGEVPRQNNSNYWRTSIMFEKWLKERGLFDVYQEMDDSQRAALQADFDTIGQEKKTPIVDKKPVANNTRTDGDQVIQNAIDRARVEKEAVEKELARQQTIRDLAGDQIPSEIVEECIRERKTIEEARAAFLNYLIARANTAGLPAAHITDNNYGREEMEVGLLLREQFSEDDLVKEYGEKVVESARKNLRGVGLQAIMQRVIHMENKPYNSLNRDEMIRTAFSTVTLPKLLANVANKASLLGYRNATATWRNWCSIGSVTDFKAHTRIRITDGGGLQQVPPSGEIGHGTIHEEYEEQQAQTYGKLFSISRQNIYNDDLRELMKTPQRFGSASAKKISDLVYTHLLANGNMSDGVALFHADHSNLNTGNALDESGLDAAVTAFRKQTDADGSPIDIAPNYLIVPPDLEGTALRLLNSDKTLAISTDVDGTVFTRPDANIWKGRLTLVVDPRLSNSSYTGYSATTWYLSASPIDADTIEVAFLNGKQEPTIESFQMDVDQLGIVYRVYMDAGVKALDWRSVAKNTA